MSFSKMFKLELRSPTGINSCLRNLTFPSFISTDPILSSSRRAEDYQAFDFQIGDQFQIPRAMVDAAAEKFDRCAQQYLSSDLTFEEILAKCPIKYVSKAEQGQTCVINVAGTVYEKETKSGECFARVIEATSCDFIGYGKNTGQFNTGFTTCWAAIYEGSALKGYEPENQTSLISKVNRRKVTKNCRKNSKNRRRMSRCIQASLSKMMKN